MKKLLEILTLLIFIINFSCSKDENKDNIQEQITIESSNLNITISENPVSDEIIGQIQATTNIGQLTYYLISQNPNDAFSIDSENGELTVLDKTLYNYETNPKIVGLVKITNSSVSKESTIIINLTNIEGEIFIGNIILKSQEEVNNFGNQNYEVIDGSLTISDSEVNITNIDALNSITLITGNLNIINNELLTNIDGLDKIGVIGRSLDIGFNERLLNISAVSKIKMLSDLSIHNNSVLDNIAGLANLITINGGLGIYKNPALLNMDALSNLTSIGAGLYISNTIFENIDALNNIQTINGPLDISNNALLKNLDGLVNLTSIGGVGDYSDYANYHFVVEENPLLNDFCGVLKLFDEGFPYQYSIYENAYNPQKQDLIDGSCIE